MFDFELIVCSSYIQTHRIVAKFHNPYTGDPPFEKLKFTELAQHKEGTPWAGNSEHQRDGPTPSRAEDGGVVMGVIRIVVDVSSLLALGSQKTTLSLHWTSPQILPGKILSCSILNCLSCGYS